MNALNAKRNRIVVIVKRRVKDFKGNKQTSQLD
jgi:hypothetical protein